MAHQLSQLSHRHHAIAEWFIANPDRSKGECARALGYTQPWLSQIIHSDAFQTYYRQLLGDYVDERILPLRDKLNNVAHHSLDRLATQLEPGSQVELDPRDLAQIADKTLARLGYGAPQGQGGTVGNMQVNNYYSVDSEVLARARERFNAKYAVPNDEPPEGGGDGPGNDQHALEYIPDAPAIPPGSEHNVGLPPAESPASHSEEAEPGQGPSGSEGSRNPL